MNIALDFDDTYTRDPAFCKALIEECEQALNPMLRDMISRDQAFQLIKKHFGVE